ncbi:hypothetical protein COEREDRAFT_80943 [Coemansia reversa NRRL 1564]|uniref:Pentacotripeptide-repeat region of PRORP domain-containing protein n=1 Tax=Coemansia reversa (strain ATCC 12441 / NRRL 1564) TaxID=763665 RepID=A0A2G5BD08_COERN|nr:hypothetical protein COEREDRAFT_80943 [Coemansia reversa NRRL 1564]|eukprot:PIA16891.1 hypothetical protein COEREDRAFT_80943 [Coemansia reversa NRRL 1564]
MFRLVAIRACICTLPTRAIGSTAGGIRRQYTSDTEDIWIKRRPLPTTTSVEYTIPTDPYLLAKKFQQVTRDGKLDDAVAIVMQTKTRNQSAVVWNMVIGEYAKSGRLSRALRGFTEMRKRGFKPTQSTFTALLKACAMSDSAKSAQMAEYLFGSIKDHGIEPSILNFNALLSVYQHKHDLKAIMEWFNDLPGEGPHAPILETYTIVLTAFRREIQRQLKELEEVKASGKTENKPSFGDSRRIALVKENIHNMFGSMVELWKTFAEDAQHRLKSQQTQQLHDTKPLYIDAHLMKVILKTCHAVYGENRALGRQGLKIAEQVYGFDKTLGSTTKRQSREDDLVVPLAVRFLQGGSSSNTVADFSAVDSNVIDLVLGLCSRDAQYTKAIRFWRSLETHFITQLDPLKKEFEPRIKEFYARASIPRSDNSVKTA